MAAVLLLSLLGLLRRLGVNIFTLLSSVRHRHADDLCMDWFSIAPQDCHS